MKAMVPDPLAYQYQHRDGLRSTIILLHGMVRDFTFAANIEGQSKIFSTQMSLPMPDGRTTLASYESAIQSAFRDVSDALATRATVNCVCRKSP